MEPLSLILAAAIPGVVASLNNHGFDKGMAVGFPALAVERYDDANLAASSYSEPSRSELSRNIGRSLALAA